MNRKNICEICTLIMGQSPDSKSYNKDKNGIPFYQGNADFGEEHPTPTVWCTAPKKIARKGDILISVRAPIGDMNIANEDCCIGRGLAAIRLNKSDIVDINYLYHYLSATVEFLQEQGTGSTFKAINKTTLEGIEIPCPSIEKQKNIAKLIIEIKTSIQYKKAELFALNELVKSRFIEMFGHPDANEKGWEKSKLENFINVVGGYAFKSQKYLSKGIPVLRIGNINAGYFRDTNLVFYQEDSALEKYKIYPNDLVISLTGTAGKDDYGNICLMDSTYGVYYLNQRNAKIEIKHNFNRFFLMYLFAHPEIKQRLTGKNHGIRQGNKLNKDILELDVYVPPIELQNEFADFVKLIDKSKFIVQKQIDDLQELLDSKMDEYFG